MWLRLKRRLWQWTALLLISGLPGVVAAEAPPLELPQEGRDYVLLPNPGTFTEAAPDTVEVVAVFAYTCTYCFEFESLLTHWAASLPDKVSFVRMPAAFGGAQDAWARVYYTNQQLGIAERSHLPLYQALHEQRSLPMQRIDAKQLAEFFSAHFGIDRAHYLQILLSEEIGAKAETAAAFSRRTRVPGTPALIVAGKYLVGGQSFADYLRTADALIARERATITAAETDAHGDTK